jgi:hypothetical protein
MASCAPTGAVGDLGIILNSATVHSPYPVPWGDSRYDSKGTNHD